MDLRPKLAREFAQAIMEDLVSDTRPGESVTVMPGGETLDRWTDLILERFVSHSIRFNDYVSTMDPGATQAFLDKYPGLVDLVDFVKGRVIQVWPKATFRLELHSDPECCHICHEGQSLCLEVNTHDDTSRSDHEEQLDDLLYSEGSLLMSDHYPERHLFHWTTFIRKP